MEGTELQDFPHLLGASSPPPTGDVAWRGGISSGFGRHRRGRAGGHVARRIRGSDQHGGTLAVLFFSVLLRSISEPTMSCKILFGTLVGLAGCGR